MTRVTSLSAGNSAQPHYTGEDETGLLQGRHPNVSCEANFRGAHKNKKR